MLDNDNWVFTSHEEREQEFMRRCIREKNLWALDLMIADTDYELYTNCYAPDQEDLNLAVEQGNKDVIKLLCKCDLAQVHSSDDMASLLNWESRESALGDEFATWLLQYMSGSHSNSGNTRHWVYHRFSAPFRFLRHLD